MAPEYEKPRPQPSPRPPGWPLPQREKRMPLPTGLEAVSTMLAITASAGQRES